MTWLNLIPQEMAPGDHWDDDLVIDSIEPVESPAHCLIVFDDGTSVIWPLEAPRRIWRHDLPLWKDVEPKKDYL